MSSLLSYFGGKHNMRHAIVAQIRKFDVGCYVEPYFGAGHVLFELLQSPNRISNYFCNDLNKYVYSFWKVITNESDSDLLMKKLLETPYCRDVKRDIQAVAHDYEQPPNQGFDASKMTREELLDNAWRMFVLSRQGFGGVVGGMGWGSCFVGSNAAKKYNKYIKMIPSYHRLLKYCQFTCDDAFSVIRNCDNDKVLFYLDPPYYDVSNKYDGYLTDAPTLQYIKDLVTLLSNCKGISILSHTLEPSVDEFVKSVGGWRRKEIKMKSKLLGRTHGGKKNFKEGMGMRVEMLYVRASERQWAGAKEQMQLF